MPIPGLQQIRIQVRDDKGACPSLKSCGSTNGKPRPGLHTVNPDRALGQWASAGLSYSGPQLGLYTAGQSGFHTTSLGRPLSR